MKFISLFAGVGGFDLGMEKAGHTCVAQVEWDKNAAGVRKRRWPDVPLFCDVSKVTADDLPDCDFITYGFPCQDLSVAGNRKGLEGERSGLFFEATRLFRELLGRGSGLRFAVAENVAGLFSADDGLALARCIRELLDCGACETGWRLLDSAYFGVAQRRKRVFLVSDFGGESCDEILAISQSLRGYPAPRRETGEDSPSNAGGGFTAGSFGGYEEGVGTLRSQGGDLGGGSETLAVWPEVSMPCMSRDYKGPRNYQDGGLQNSVVTGCDVYNGDTTPKASEDVSVTLRSQQGGEGVGVATYDARGNGDGLTTCTLTGDHQSRVTDYTSLAASNLTVRRLTPKECERLQGFPDDWTSERAELELDENEWKAAGKVVKQADGPRYKQMGNAVTVNVAKWLGERLSEAV